MCYSASCLGIWLLVILFGYAILIYFGLRYRKTFLAENLQLSPDQVYMPISQQAAQLGFSKADLLYGIYQDKTASVMQTVVKDSTGGVIGSIEQHLGVRGTDIFLGNEKYEIEYPLTWRTSAHLKNANGEILARVERLPFSIREHKIIIPNIGVFISQSHLFKFRYHFEYRLNGAVVGMTRRISNQEVGGIALVPSHYPLILRVFILAINAIGI